MLAPLLAGVAGPQPLLVGVVHDQFGEAVAGAVVQAGGQTTTTDRDGTFSLTDRDPSGSIVVTCPYCRPLKEQYDASQPVIAIVQRYDAVARTAPTGRDYAALPYSSAASSVSLTPFAVLDDSVSPITGARVSMFAASPFWGGLTIDDGIPNYDITASSSTFVFLPAAFVQQIDVLGPEWAFRYGDNTGSGTFLTDTRPDLGTSATLSAGGLQIARVAQNSGNFSSTVGLSSSATDSRDRIDATFNEPIGDGDQLTATAIAAGSHDAPEIESTLDSAFNALRLNYRHARADVVQADVLVDSAGYNGTLYQGAGVAASWSDFQADASLQTPGAVHGFLEAGYRDSNGSYGDPTLSGPIAGSIAQGRIDAGLRIDTPRLTGQAGVGAFSVGYSGGALGYTQPFNARILVPSASLTYSFAPGLSGSISTGQWFRLPSLLQTYASWPATFALQKDSSSIEQLDFGDLHRVRLELMGMQGAARGSGGDVAWEIAPNISLRAWTMHFQNGAEQNTGTVNAVWSTYENPFGLRVDLIERRDELDEAPDQHFDGSASVPLTGHIRLFTATERRRLTRTFTAGLQLVP